ncbi:MAG: DUF751 family protein [Acaryochloridaceae cyanobacterium SU_2_1]|nr:DUF751 family protein [Acaryochloridaceae cyanobacterium SU_2_1]
MLDFIKNFSRYPKYLIAIVLGIFWNLIKPMKGFLQNPLTALALLGLLAGGTMFLTLTLSAMLGLTSLE